MAATAPHPSRAPHGTSQTGQDYALILDTINTLDKRSAVNYLLHRFPSLSSSWVRRHWNRLTAMHPDQLRRTLGIPDPVGESVARNVDAGRTSLWAERRGGEARA